MRVEININLDLRHKIENSAARASAIIEAASKESADDSNIRMRDLPNRIRTLESDH